MNYSFLLESVWHPPLAFEEVAAPDPPSELELQALWFSGAFGTNFTLKDGRNCRIEQFGEWNLGAGPDFHHAAITIEGTTTHGDIEIDTSSTDWENHGHSINPDFSNTLLHVAFQPALRETFIRTCDHRQIPEILISPAQLSDALRLPPRKTAISKPGRCLKPLAKIPPSSIERLLREAALHRAHLKYLRFQATADAHGLDTALFWAIAETLGYGGNSLPMKLLAQRSSISWLRSNPHLAEPILLGTAGFLDAELYQRAPDDTKAYLQSLWQTWWRHRPTHETIERQTPPWKTHGQRPANHPHRRVGSLSALIAQWARFKRLACADPFSPSALNDFLQNLKHPFWSHHHTLTSQRSSKPISAFGKNLSRELAANHLIPLAIHSGRFSYDQYQRIRHSAINQKLKRCAIRLFGSEKTAKPYLRKIAHQQAMLQLYHDFCLQDLTNCRQCPFPEQLAQWK